MNSSRYSINSVLEDSRQLAERMRLQDESFDFCIKRCNTIRDFLIEKRKYQESTMKLHELMSCLSAEGVVPPPGQTNPVLCSAAENKQLENLRNDNQVLTCILEEYQTAMELVMTKYRSQMAANLYQQEGTSDPTSATIPTPTTPDLASSLTEGLCKGELVTLVQNLYQQMQDLTLLSQDSMQASSDLATQMEDRIRNLEIENETLRHLMHLQQHPQPNATQVTSSSTSSVRDSAGEEGPLSTSSSPPSTTLSAVQALLLAPTNTDNAISQDQNLKRKRPVGLETIQSS